MLLNFTKFCLGFLCLALGVLQIEAVTIDTASRSNRGDFTLGGVRTTPLTLTVNIQEAGEVLYVGVSNNTTLTATPTQLGCLATLPPTGTVSAITYNNVAGFTRYTTPTTNFNAVVSPNGCTSVEVFRFINPPTGAGTLSVNIPVGGDYVVIGAVAAIGADSQFSTAGALFSATGTGGTPTLTVPTTAGDFVLDVIAAEFNSLDLIPNATQTREWRQLADPAPPPPFYVGAGSTKAAAAIAAGLPAGTTMTWNNRTGGWALGGILIEEVVLASSVSIEGRAIDSSDRALPRVSVTLTDSEGNKQTALTSAFGYYRFENIAAGQTIVLQARSKQHSFAPRVLTALEDLQDIDLTADELN